MYQTIQIAGQITAQGLLVRRLSDGRVVVDLGDRQVVGLPVVQKLQ